MSCATLKASSCGHDLAQALKTKGIIEKMNAQDVSQVAWSLHKINAFELLPLLRPTINKVCTDFKVVDLANTATAFAGVNFCCDTKNDAKSVANNHSNSSKDPCVWHALADVAKDRLKWFSAHDLGTRFLFLLQTIH